jgi:hypothetical protein
VSAPGRVADELVLDQGGQQPGPTDRATADDHDEIGSDPGEVAGLVRRQPQAAATRAACAAGSLAGHLAGRLSAEVLAHEGAAAPAAGGFFAHQPAATAPAPVGLTAQWWRFTALEPRVPLGAVHPGGPAWQPDLHQALRVLETEPAVGNAALAGDLHAARTPGGALLHPAGDPGGQAALDRFVAQVRRDRQGILWCS